MKKILIIDDDKELLNELTELFESNGYSVTSFTDGSSALLSISKNIPDIILLDLKMDGMSGFHVADKLNCSPQTQNIPIIAMTGHFTQTEFFLIMKICGMKKCIKKPFSPEEVLNEIKNALVAEDKVKDERATARIKG